MTMVYIQITIGLQTIVFIGPKSNRVISKARRGKGPRFKINLRAAIQRFPVKFDRLPVSGVTGPTESAPRPKEDGHRGSWLKLSLPRPNERQVNHEDQPTIALTEVG